MASRGPLRADERARPAPPVSIHGRAADDLQFIRQAMERSSTFTAVPGVGGAVMGGIGIAAAVIGAWQPTPERWLAVWLGAACLAFIVGAVTMRRKAAAGGMPLTGAVGRRFALSVSAPLVSGAALTAGLWQRGDWPLMATVWLLLYGTGVLIGGASSVAPLRVLGLCFMALGGIAMLTPPSWGNLWLGIGFGVLQAGFGLYIARKHGG